MAKNILVIDDEELITKSLLRLLQSEGYDVTIAKSGLEGIEKVREMDFDLIITDVRMPGLDGIETVKRIRSYLAESSKRPIPEVMITGYVDGDKYEKALDLEVTDYLSKPFDNDEFLKIVKKALG